MSRTPRPIDEDRLTACVMQMITAHRDKPCPTRREIVEWTGLPRREVWAFLDRLVVRGMIEIEVRGRGTDNVWRRMRTTNGQWTGWTARRKSITERPRLLERMREDAHA